MLALFAGGSHMHLCEVTDVDLCCTLLVATRLEIIAAIWEQVSPNLQVVSYHMVSYQLQTYTYPAMQLQCAANTSPMQLQCAASTSPSSSVTTHGISGVADILCECITNY